MEAKMGQFPSYPAWTAGVNTPGLTVSTDGSILAVFLMHDMSKPYTLSQKSIFSTCGQCEDAYCP